MKRSRTPKSAPVLPIPPEKADGPEVHTETEEPAPKAPRSFLFLRKRLRIRRFTQRQRSRAPKSAPPFQLLRKRLTVRRFTQRQRSRPRMKKSRPRAALALPEDS